MKKTMVYILALSMLAVTLLAGCGETGDNRNDAVQAPQNTGVLPDMENLVPDVLEPNANNGEVNDTDGIITDGDNGGVDRTESGSGSGADRTTTAGGSDMSNASGTGNGSAGASGNGASGGTIFQ